jgi:hypothetical protein
MEPHFVTTMETPSEGEVTEPKAFVTVTVIEALAVDPTESVAAAMTVCVLATSVVEKLPPVPI